MVLPQLDVPPFLQAHGSLPWNGSRGVDEEKGRWDWRREKKAACSKTEHFVSSYLQRKLVFKAGRPMCCCRKYTAALYVPWLSGRHHALALGAKCRANVYLQCLSRYS